MESILTTLKDFGYFNAGAIVGGAVIFLFAVLAFSSPMWFQMKDIERLTKKNKDLTERNTDLEALNKSCQKYKEQFQMLYYSELSRANLLEDSNMLLQGLLNDEKEFSKRIYVELDALKAHNFPKDEKKQLPGTAPSRERYFPNDVIMDKDLNPLIDKDIEP